jgi:hypothetical protein
MEKLTYQAFGLHHLYGQTFQLLRIGFPTKFCYEGKVFREMEQKLFPCTDAQIAQIGGWHYNNY